MNMTNNKQMNQPSSKNQKTFPVQPEKFGEGLQGE